MKIAAVSRLASIGALALILSSCGSAEEGGSSEERLRIGYIASLSGGTGAVGKEMQQGAELAVEQINADGGIDGRQVELVSRDAKGDPAEGVAIVRELTSEGINLFTGLVSSGVALALPQTLQQTDSVIITTAAGDDKITGENFSENVFRISDNTYMRSVASARFLRDRYPDVHRWANLSPDYAYGHAAWERFDEAMKELDPEYEVVASQFPQFGAPDFRNDISVIVNAKPQGLFMALYSSDAITMAKQAEAYELFDKVEVAYNTSNEGDISDGWGENAHTEWGATHYLPEAFDNQMSKDFVEAFQAKFAEGPNGYNSESYTAMYAYKQAIEDAGSTDTSDVIESLEGLKMDSVTGQREIRAEDHQTIKDIGFVLFDADPNSERGWKITDTQVFPGKEVMPPIE